VVEPPPVVAQPGAAKGTLKITLAEPASWADVKVNGTVRRKSLKPSDQPLVLTELDPGKYTIEATGYLRNRSASYSEEFELKSGQELPVTITLTQASNAPPKQK
jgi:hypothetical protein